MECHVCNRYAGAACYHCDRPVCNSHVAKRTDGWSCKAPDQVCQGNRVPRSETGVHVSRPIVITSASDFGKCPHPRCKCDLGLLEGNEPGRSGLDSFERCQQRRACSRCINGRDWIGEECACTGRYVETGNQHHDEDQ